MQSMIKYVVHVVKYIVNSELFYVLRQSMKGHIKLLLVNSNSGEVHNKLKYRGFRATSLPTYDF